jgi:hypothetical protein
MNGKPKSAWRSPKRCLLGLAGLVVLIGLIYAEEDWRGWHDWNQFRLQWEAKGERFDRASFVPPAVPDDQNFALTPVVASCYSYILDANGHKISPPDTNVVNRLMMEIPPESAKGIGNWQKSTASKLESPAADVLLALSKYDPAIEELRQASQMPLSRFPLNYDNDPPAAILLPHLAALKKCAQVLQLRAIAELQNEQSDLALADVKLGIQLTGKVRTEPFLISHLVRIAMLNITLQPIWEGLARHKWSEAQLAELEQELGKLDFPADYESAMRGERGLEIGNIEYVRRTHHFEMLNDSGNNQSHQSAQTMVFRLMPNAWYYQNELAIARMYQQWVLPSVDVERRTVSLEAVHRNEAAATNKLSHLAFYDVFARMLFPAVSPAVRRFAFAQVSADLTRVAIALERYRLAHGDYPDSLEALAPRFVAELPHDIINGQPSQGYGPASQPLHYRRTPDGQFVLYSVGWNGTDDDGDVVFNKGASPTVNLNEGDWVWRYPDR